MKRIDSKTDLRRMVSEWIQDWDMDCYIYSFDDLVDHITDELADELYYIDFEYGNEIDTDLLDIDGFSKDFEKEQVLSVYRDYEDGEEVFVCCLAWDKNTHRDLACVGQIVVVLENTPIFQMKNADKLFFRAAKEFKKGTEKFNIGEITC